MTGWLDHLAAVAMGEVPADAARLSDPSRFAPMQAVEDGWEMEAQADTVTRVTDLPVEPVPPSRPIEQAAAAAHVATASPAEAAATMQIPAALPRLDARPRDLPAISVASDARPSVASPATVPVAPVVASVTLGPAPIQPMTPPPAPPVPPLAARPAPAAPLRPETVAQRIAPPPAPAPVISVTIDRIDLRGPVPRPAAPPRRERPRPSVSLTEYLRDAGRQG